MGNKIPIVPIRISSLCRRAVLINRVTEKERKNVGTQGIILFLTGSGGLGDGTGGLMEWMSGWEKRHRVRLKTVSEEKIQRGSLFYFFYNIMVFCTFFFCFFSFLLVRC